MNEFTEESVLAGADKINARYEDMLAIDTPEYRRGKSDCEQGIPADIHGNKDYHKAYSRHHEYEQALTEMTGGDNVSG